MCVCVCLSEKERIKYNARECVSFACKLLFFFRVYYGDDDDIDDLKKRQLFCRWRADMCMHVILLFSFVFLRLLIFSFYLCSIKFSFFNTPTSTVNFFFVYRCSFTFLSLSLFTFFVRLSYLLHIFSVNCLFSFDSNEKKSSYREILNFKL